MRELYFNETLPYALSIGMTEERFWESNPNVIKVYEKAYKIKLERYDEMAWSICGNYIMSAFSTVLSKAFSKKGIDYIKEPLTRNKAENDHELTEEEISELRMRFTEKIDRMGRKFDNYKKNKGSN